ncbi:hypothetical protein [Sphingobium sp. BS19]|uniref:hypothetical protein n=1 Tax=Sphingobium sp. BS19 TaxID=3018973 RepID=UPI002491AFAA|nr:hypothetical protein [Sphingobium sp. BS19]
MDTRQNLHKPICYCFGILLVIGKIEQITFAERIYQHQNGFAQTQGSAHLAAALKASTCGDQTANRLKTRLRPEDHHGPMRVSQRDCDRLSCAQP